MSVVKQFKRSSCTSCLQHKYRSVFVSGWIQCHFATRTGGANIFMRSMSLEAIQLAGFGLVDDQSAVGSSALSSDKVFYVRLEVVVGRFHRSSIARSNGGINFSLVSCIVAGQFLQAFGSGAFGFAIFTHGRTNLLGEINASSVGVQRSNGSLFFCRRNKIPCGSSVCTARPCD